MNSYYGLTFLTLALFLSTSESHANEELQHPLYEGFLLGLNPIVGCFLVPAVATSDQLDLSEKGSFGLGLAGGLFLHGMAWRVSYSLAKKYTAQPGIGTSVLMMGLMAATVSPILDLVRDFRVVHGVSAINT